MGTPIPYPRFRGTYVDPVTGVEKPLAGGKLYTYLLGTVTPYATFSDYATSSANTNPVILDANGEAWVFTDSTPLTFKLTDSADNVQTGWPKDGLNTYTVSNVVAYTPTLTNFAASAMSAKYVLNGKLCHVKCTITLFGAASGTMHVSLPFAPDTAFTGTACGDVHGVRSNNYTGVVYQTATDVEFMSTAGLWNATVPGIWAGGDTISFTCTYFLA